MKKKRESGGGRPPEDSPAAWFAVLEAAKTANDFDLAAKARRELARLGVRVIYAKAAKGVASGPH